MVTNGKRKYPNSYSKALAEVETLIIKDFTNRIPFGCFPGKTDFSEVIIEMDKWKEQYKNDIPQWDMRQKGWQWIYTLKEGKKKVWIE